MTRKQILKSIETAEKNIAKFQKNVQMYTERRDKAIAKAAKKGVNVTLDDFTYELSLGMYFVSTKDYEFGRENYDILYPVRNNYESVLDNQRKADRESRKLEELNKELAQLNAEENHVTDLVETIAAAMQEFKVEWFAKMQDYHKRLYKYVQKRLPEARIRYARIKRILDRMERQYHIYSYNTDYEIRNKKRHGYLYLRLKKAYKDAAAIVFNPAARMNEEEYKVWALKEINAEWDSNMRVLVKKLEDFNLNLSEVKVDGVDTTSKGFECYVTDGCGRTIYARMIWAAKCSIFVAPHTRYIITERH